MNPIDRLLEEAWRNGNDDTARRNFRTILAQLQDAQNCLVLIDHMAETMLKDKKVDFRKYDDEEQKGGQYIHQCLHGACEALHAAHARILTYYKAERGDDSRG